MDKNIGLSRFNPASLHFCRTMYPDKNVTRNVFSSILQQSQWIGVPRSIRHSTIDQWRPIKFESATNSSLTTSAIGWNTIERSTVFSVPFVHINVPFFMFSLSLSLSLFFASFFRFSRLYFLTIWTRTSRDEFEYDENISIRESEKWYVTSLDPITPSTPRTDKRDNKICNINNPWIGHDVKSVCRAVWTGRSLSNEQIVSTWTHLLQIVRCPFSPGPFPMPTYFQPNDSWSLNVALINRQLNAK